MQNDTELPTSAAATPRGPVPVGITLASITSASHAKLLRIARDIWKGMRAGADSSPGDVQAALDLELQSTSLLRQYDAEHPETTPPA